MADAPNSPGSSAAAAPLSGALWKDRYLIEKELGRGGIGVVYLAHDQQLHSKPVVLKVLQDETTLDPYLQKKFQQEIEALSRIDHPGVVGVLDVGVSPEGRPFLVMQYVEGVTLRSALTKDGMEFSRVAHILRQVGQALGAAHDKGIYHRDLKPENIMLTRSGDTEEYVKLIDFGIAAVRDSQVAAQQTQPSKVVGTLSYMAPEQAMGKGSPASDIYSLGVIAFEMLTGQRPEVSWDGVAKKPRELRPAIPDAAQEIILNALAYQPEKRMIKPRDFGDQMARALGAEPTITSPLPATPAVQAPSQPSSTTGLETGYVLFMDIVAYSKMSMDLQRQRIQQLADIVRNTAEYKSAQQSGQIVSLPTGDGMALVFFQKPIAPVECAKEIARALKSNPEIKLRMGVNAGPVYRVADINTNSNVAGGGINMAQRVMDSGDSGHILLSKRVADDLEQLSDWAPTLHDLGEAEVKHGVKVNIVNFYTDEVGNSAVPEKILKSRVISAPAGPPPLPVPAAPVAVVQAAPSHTLQPTIISAPVSAPISPPSVQYIPEPPPKSNTGLILGGVGALVAVIAVAAYLKLAPSSKVSEPGGGTPASQSSFGPSGGPAGGSGSSAGSVETKGPTPGIIPPSGSPPANPPASSAGNSPEPAQPSRTASTSGTPAIGKTESATIPGRPAATRVLRRLEAQAEVAQGADATSSQPAMPAQAALTPAERAELQKARERMIDLASRAEAIGKSVRTLEERQKAQGVGLRADMAAARSKMEYLMGETKAAIDAKDSETANRNMDLVEPQIEKLEGFLGR